MHEEQDYIRGRDYDLGILFVWVVSLFSMIAIPGISQIVVLIGNVSALAGWLLYLKDRSWR